jgi:hypothetical protein
MLFVHFGWVWFHIDAIQWLCSLRMWASSRCKRSRNLGTLVDSRQYLCSYWSMRWAVSFGEWIYLWWVLWFNRGLLVSLLWFYLSPSWGWWLMDSLWSFSASTPCSFCLSSCEYIWIEYRINTFPPEEMIQMLISRTHYVLLGRMYQGRSILSGNSLHECIRW